MDSRVRLAIALLAGLAVPDLTSRAEPATRESVPTEMAAAWRKISQLDFAGAAVAFEALLNEQPDSRHARLGWAITMLNRPPKKNARTMEAAKALESVRAANPDDDPGIMAAYQLARLYHVHFYPADLAEARHRYEAIHRAHPRHYFGQSALLRLASLDLFASWPSADPDRLVAKWEARKDEFTAPDLRRNFLRKLADAILWFDLDGKRALPLIMEAEEIGFSRFDFRTLMLMRIYGTGVEEGLPDIARTAARKYLQEFPRGAWSQFMRDRLAEAGAKKSP